MAAVTGLRGSRAPRGLPTAPVSPLSWSWSDLFLFSLRVGEGLTRSDSDNSSAVVTSVLSVVVVGKAVLGTCVLGVERGAVEVELSSWFTTA